MNRFPHRLTLTASMAVLTLSAAQATEGAKADTLPRPIVSTYAAEAGFVSVLDTYLTPLRHTGTGMALSGRWSKMLPSAPGKLFMDFDAALEGAVAGNPSRSRNLYDASVQVSWGVNRLIRPASGWSVAAGGAIGFDAGAIYLPKPGNNPVSAQIDAMISIRATATYTTHLGHHPLLITDRVSLPATGVFFAPAFGETYYEIYLGNRSGLAHCAWWGNHFCIDNLLSAEIVFPSRSLLIGYRWKVRSSWINDLNTQRVSHSLVVGVTFGRRCANPNTFMP